MLGEGPAPFMLRRFMLAAGMGEVGGLGAAAVYGRHPLLSQREFAEAYAMQQLLLRHASEEGREDGRKTRDIRRTVALEKQGVLEDDGISHQPSWVPQDPMDPGYDPSLLPPEVRSLIS